MNKYLYYGETFNGTKGVVVGNCVYNCPPLIAIEKYCNDEIHCCNMNDYDWYLEDDLIYKGKTEE